MSCRKRGRDEKVEESTSVELEVGRIGRTVLRIMPAGLAVSSTSTTAIPEAGAYAAFCIGRADFIEHGGAAAACGLRPPRPGNFFAPLFPLPFACPLAAPFPFAPFPFPLPLLSLDSNSC